MGYGLGNLGDLSGDGRNEISIANLLDALLITFDSYSLTTNGYGGYGSWGHLRSEYLFGASLEPLGDLPHGKVMYPVVASGIPHDDEGRVSGGAVYLLYLKSAADESITIHHARKIVPGVRGTVADDQPDAGEVLPACRPRSSVITKRIPRGIPLCPQRELRAGDMFGQGLTLLGDLDGNGVRDLAVGAPGNGGAIWILRLNLNGTTHLHVRIDDHTPGLGGAAGTEAEFGHAVAYLGDLDGDGAFELAVGLPGKDAVYVLSIAPGGQVTRVRRIADGEGSVPAGTVQEGSRFGNALATADVTGDGRQELLVGAPLYVETPFQSGGISSDAGAVYVFSLSDDAEVGSPVQRISRFQGMVGAFGVHAPNDGDQFGWSVSGLGDINGDGREDLVIGAPEKYDARGAAYVVHLDADSKVNGGFLITEGRSGFQGPLAARGDNQLHASADRFGASVSPVVLERDGLLELVVGGEGEGLWNHGGIWVLRTQMPADEAVVGDSISDNPNLDAPPGAGVPEAYELSNSYPNPFSYQTRIRFGLPEPGPVRLEVFDVLGRSVRVLADGPHEAGWHEVRFDGGGLAAGVYLVQLQAGPFHQTQRVLLMR